MNIAILKITNTVELTVTVNNRILSFVSLEPKDLLIEAYEFLKNLEIEELRAVFLPTVLAHNVEDQLCTSKFVSNGTQKYAFINTEDIGFVKRLGNQLNVKTIKIYDTLSIYRLYGAKEPVIVFGENIGNSYSYAYVDQTGIKEFATTGVPNDTKLKSLMKYYNTTKVVSFYSDIMLPALQQIYDNLKTLTSKEQMLLAPSLCTELVVTKIIFDNANYQDESMNLTNPISLGDAIGDAIEQEPEDLKDSFDDFVETEPLLGDNGIADESLRKGNYPVREIEEEVDDLEDELEEAPKKRKGKTILLDIVGVLVAVGLAGSIACNKALPSQITYLQDKVSQIQQVEQPLASASFYYTNYKNALNDGKNYDTGVLQDISSLKVNGIISEVKLHYNEVGVQVYLKNEKDIPDLESKLNKIFKVSNISNDGTVEVGKDKLTKLVVSGTLNP